MAHLTYFSFEFFYKILPEDASLPLPYRGAKKSKMTKNSNQGGPALKQNSIAFLAPISWLALLAISPKLGRLQRIQSHFSRQYCEKRFSQLLLSLFDYRQISIAFLAPISWPALLATSRKLGRLQKIFNRISRASIVTTQWHSHHPEWLFKIFQSHIRLVNSTCYWQNVWR